MPPRLAVTAFAIINIWACVSEGRRPGPGDTDGDLACQSTCADDYPAPPPCFTAVWNEATCACSLVAAEDDAPCDDGNACTLEDRCRNNTCVGALVDLRTHCDDGDDCTEDNCDQRLGCVHDPVDAGQLCDDGNRCTIDSRCNELGQCRWDNQYVCGLCDPDAPDPEAACAAENLEQDLCDGRLACRAGFCEVDPATVPRCDDPRLGPCVVTACEDGACTSTPRPDGTPCSDLSSCTLDDTCQDGVCVGTPSSAAACACKSPDDCAAFDDGDPCNGVMTCRATPGAPSVAGSSGVCVFDFASIVVCDPAEDTACALNRCAPETGQCALTPIADESACDDGDPCTVGDTCLAGACRGTERDCRALDGRCLVGVCDRLLGCVAELAPADTACVPAAPCASAGTCDADGNCVAPIVGCDDGDPCTVDLCDEESGECRFTGPEPPTCDALGVCAGGVPLRCELGSYLCDYQRVAGWSAIEKCDGLDDDCDGATDDACIAGEACAEGALLSAWSGTMQACAGPTSIADTTCGQGWHPCSYSAMVDSLAGDAPPAGYYIAASIAFSPGQGYQVHDRPPGACFEFEGVCTNAREVQAMSWDGVFGQTVAYAAEAWGCDAGIPQASCETVVFDGVLCCADTCDEDADCADESPCTEDRCVSGRCFNDPGPQPSCRSGGPCAGLQPSCQADGTWICDYAGVAGYEEIEATCDALDNDCDGKVDAADPDFAGLGDPCELQAGVCDGARKRSTACVNGIWRVCGEDDYAAHSLHYEDAFEGLCDGRDNNCDGATDGGFAWRGVALGESCDGQGECGTGVVECAPSRAGATCSTNPLGSASQASAELCNGLDDDCDGQTDEASDLDPDQSGCGAVGVCQGLRLGRCVDGGWVCETSALPGFGAEICDGLDNDCDGQTDEGFAVGGLALGASCGPAGCPNGVVICAEGGQRAICSSDLGLELCDGIDNDCDGQTDEEVRYADPALGARTLGQSCSARGTCGTGVVECGADRQAICSTHAGGSASQATLERCDGLDDDCDGLTDEGFAWHDVAVGQACEGAGVCGAGVVVCTADGARATCSTQPDAPGATLTTETCNGLDDDCDGQTDEALVAGPEDCPVEGVCRPEMVDARCLGAAGWSCDHGNNPYYQAGDEGGRCDRLDNDCDGLTDEDFPTLGESCDGPDPDACALGVVTCDPSDPTKTRCAGDFARAETCNGVDDDCDGETDEIGAAGCTVYFEDLDEDGFGAASRCACAPGDGFTATVGGDCRDDLLAVNPTAPELCNGVDDDCDGKTDAADAADLVVDDVVPCELQLGVCQGTDKNANRCVAGAWQPCQPSDYLARNAAYQHDKETRCDGLDNDCDGHVDAADPDVAGSPPACELTQGLCAGVKKPLSLCQPSGWAPCTTEVYTAHAPAYEAGTEASCDDRDNDCDGLVDDEFAFTGKKVGQSCDGTGACGLGTVECTADQARATCSTNPDGSAPQAVAETCNGLDDDCDGQTDDGLGLAQSPCRKTGVCTPDQVLATCVQGIWSCDYSEVDDYETPSEASCDDLDNDCDGQTDEDMSVVVDGQTRRKGDPCGSGACSGVIVCDTGTAAAGDLICSAELSGGAEICDGLDNDCDGETDEGLSWTPTGGNPIALGQPCEGFGECGTGVVECTATGGTACSTNPDGSDAEDEDELCNGLDDDCDRASDEGFAWQGIAVGQSCDGIGACGPGVVECIGGGSASTCSSNPDGSASQASAEVCNGADDDCDGQTDEGLGIAQSPCRVTGVCTTQNVIATCNGAGGWSCDYSQVPYYHAGDELGYCDTLDNDCDGQTDEDYPELGESCDLPNDPDLCAYGTWRCSNVSTQPVDPAEEDGAPVPGDATGAPYCDGDTPSPEVCGGGDDDCDGTTDEEGAQGCKVYFRDGDGDGYGREHDFKCLCTATAPYTSQKNQFDCDDGDPFIHPGMDESCNEEDDDCNGVTDDDGTFGCSNYYYDFDGDSWGVSADARCLCFAHQGEATGHTAESGGDCDDTLSTVHPNAPELCDGDDNDCDEKVDDADPPVQDCTTFYYDNDGDTFGIAANSQCRCLPSGKYTATQTGDCCDLDNRSKPTQQQFYPSQDACGSWDYNCSGMAEKQNPDFGMCACKLTAPGGTTCLLDTGGSCTFERGWARDQDGSLRVIPDCGGSGEMITQCNLDFDQLRCEPTLESRTQLCH